MNIVYGALLLHDAGKEISEENLEKIMKAVDIKVDKAMVKALVSSLEGVNIDDAIKQAAFVAAAPAAGGAAEAKEEKKEEKKEEDAAKKSEEAAAGLSSLFG
ncbi:MAG: 50S ribosomal protein P1 [Candidatus Aenigmarchaeota archaeon]|nr:50S ribosomal protein P1 [Candidatus Aenigmarchaeota archaeon]